MSDCDADDERKEELDTLQSIYPELATTANYTATFDLPVAPTTPLPISFGPDVPVQRLSYLPPLKLDIYLPASYPDTGAPKIFISTSPPWLPTHVADRLAAEGSALWEEYGHTQILFAYISSLHEQAESAFGLTELELPTPMQRELIEYNTSRQRDLFERETFDCQVCLEPKKGSACYRMQRCGHVFCRGCLQDYYNTCIREGDVNNVKCMSTECGGSVSGKRKKEYLLSPKELLRIPLARDVVERYANIKRKKKIESDSSMVFCPRSWCQGAMRTAKYPKISDVAQMDSSGSGDEEDTKEAPAVEGPPKRAVGIRGMDRLAVCEDCKLAFCLVCLASWHGDFVRCQPRDANQLTEEDQASLNFIMKNTSPCPDCSVPCQKSMGCNHITCTQCKTHFCYLCGAWLDPDHPYAHFNNIKNKACYQRLMDGAEGDMADGNVQFGGRRGAEQLADFWEQEAMRMQMQINEEDTW